MIDTETVESLNDRQLFSYYAFRLGFYMTRLGIYERGEIKYKHSTEAFDDLANRAAGVMAEPDEPSHKPLPVKEELLKYALIWMLNRYFGQTIPQLPFKFDADGNFTETMRFDDDPDFVDDAEHQ